LDRERLTTARAGQLLGLERAKFFGCSRRIAL
jgi:hypothetical protein